MPSLVLTCSPADPRSVHTLHSLAPATHWARTGQSVACYCTTGPIGCRAVVWSSPCSADIRNSIFRRQNIEWPKLQNHTALTVGRHTQMNVNCYTNATHRSTTVCSRRSLSIPVARAPAEWGWPCLPFLCPSNTLRCNPLWTCHWRTRWRERPLHGSWTYMCEAIHLNV